MILGSCRHMTYFQDQWTTLNALHAFAGRELKQDLSAITSLIGSSGLPNIGGGSGFDISTITSALSGIAGSGGGLTSLAR